MKNKFTLLLLIPAIFVACGKKQDASQVQSAGEVIPVTVIQLQPADVDQVVYSSGQFTTDDETALAFKTGGVIAKVLVRDGDAFKSGQVLATLDLTEINAQVNQAQIGFDKAQRDLKRVENLYRDSVASLEQFQNAKSGFELAQQQLAAAKFNLSYSEIRAKNDGVVLRKISNEGQIVGPGTPVIQVSSRGKKDWLLRIAVSDEDWSKIKINDPAKVSINGSSSLSDGKVFAKAESADPMTGSFFIDIKLQDSKTQHIASGMFGKAQIFLTAKNHGWEIPYESLMEGNGDNGFVFVTDDNKSAKKVEVKISAIEKNTVIISSGLEGHPNLIAKGSAYLTDGSLIQIDKKMSK